MEFRPQQAIEVLERTPTALRSMLSGLSEPWVMNNYGPETFSPFDVLGHLIHGERDDWIPRAKIILQHGQDRPFDPFDRYVMYEVSKGKTIGELLDTFESLRRDNIATLKGFALTPAQLSLKGTHPELGPVTMGAVLAMWVVHDLGHIAQIAKAMAFQYREEIGPWLADTAILRGTTARA